MSARDTPSTRIVFRKVGLAGLNQETDLLNTNLMWDVRKALPVAQTRIVTVGVGEHDSAICFGACPGRTGFSLSGFDFR